jgi:hypothetical protein
MNLESFLGGIDNELSLLFEATTWFSNSLRCEIAERGTEKCAAFFPRYFACLSPSKQAPSVV